MGLGRLLWHRNSDLGHRSRGTVFGGVIRLTSAFVGPRLISLGVRVIGVVRFTLATRTTATKNGHVFANVCFLLSGLNYSGVPPKSRISALLDRWMNARFGE
jgi:hypothetical protein